MNVIPGISQPQVLIAQAGTGGEFTSRELDRLITSGKLFKGANHTAWEYIHNNLMKTRNQAGYISDGQIRNIKHLLVEAALSSPKVTDATKDRYRPYLGNNNYGNLVLDWPNPTPGYFAIGIKDDVGTPMIVCSDNEPPISEVKKDFTSPSFKFLKP